MSDDVDYKAMLEGSLQREQQSQSELLRLQQELQELRKKLDHAKYVNAREELMREIPDYHRSTQDQLGSQTQMREHFVRPVKLVQWEGFQAEIVALLESVADKNAERVVDVVDAEHTVVNHETTVHGLLENIVRHTGKVLREALGDASLQITVGITKLTRPGGIPDILVSHQDRVIFVIELKRPSVQFDRVKNPWDHDVAAETRGNTLVSTLQTYTYMLTKGDLKYGCFTNYNNWVFLRRTIVEGKEVLEVSAIHDRSQARRALATMIYLGLQSARAALATALPPGAGLGEFMDSNNDGEEEEEDDAATGRRGGTDDAFFRSGNSVAGLRFTKTSVELPTRSLSVHAREFSELLSCSEKACTFRYRSGETDLVWRQLDVYGLPRNHSDYPLSVLRDFTVRELKAYAHLRSDWGTLVPEFVYFGQDLGMLWVLVTKYVGESLKKLAADGNGLAAKIKDKARRALIELHKRGVIHGDPLLQNVVFRVSDGRALWLDFELSTLQNELASETQFATMAEQELAFFDAQLSSVGTIQDTDVVHPPKRSKIFCCRTAESLSCLRK